MEITYSLLTRDKRRHRSIEALDSLPFGKLRTDHMFLMDFKDNEWVNARIIPYGNIDISPGAIVLHYGQAIFEGIKAFCHQDKSLYVFRPDRNARRFNHSAELLCMPTIPEHCQVEAVLRLLDVERAWCPNIPESSLYIRPVMFGCDDSIGVKASCQYTYCVFLSPSGPLYPGGFNKAVTLLITSNFHRCAPGGTGSAKTSGNYAASLRADVIAKSKGADQVLYLDCSNRYIEEVGSMNHFHITREGSLVIPEFSDTILRAITSDCVLELSSRVGLQARLQKVVLREFLDGILSGEIVESGGLGTAAVITPIGRYMLDDGTEYIVGDGQVGGYARKLYKLYSDIQKGMTEAPEGWLFEVPEYI